MHTQAIDTHAHLWPDSYLDALKKCGSPDTAVAQGIGASDSMEDLQARFEMMDKAGVKRQILSATPQIPQWGTPQENLALAQSINDRYAELVATYPQRFAAYGTVPIMALEDAIKEGQRVLQDHHFLGIALNTLIQNKYSIADERFWPFFEAMNELHAIIYIHPTGCGANSPMINDYGLEWVVGAPMEDMIATLNLLKAGIPQKYPHLKFHIAHLAGGISFQMQRIEDNYTDWHAFAESPKATLLNHFWFDTANFLEAALINSAEVFGPDRLLMGSDFPYFQNDKYTRAVDYIVTSRLSQDDKDKVLYRNAQGLYQIDGN